MSELHPQLIHSLEIFYSYAPKDKELRDKLEQHLSGMQRKGRIIGWYDGVIQAGKNHEREIAAHLNSANIILLLISPDFIASDYHQNIEVKRAMERHEFGDARVIPILLRTVDWQDTPFFKLYSLPTNGQFVVQWTDLDEAFKDIAEGIRRVVDDLSRLPPLANLELINAVQELTHGVSNEQQAAIGNILNVLKQLSRYQKMVNELKIVHNMLHNLESALEVLMRRIQLDKAEFEKKETLFRSIKIDWGEVQRKIGDIQYFAEQKMMYLEKRLEIDVSSRSGPRWIIDLLKLQDDFKASMKERNTEEVEDVSLSFLDACRYHLQVIDRQLLEAIEQVDQLSSQILRSMEYDAAQQD